MSSMLSKVPFRPPSWVTAAGLRNIPGSRMLLAAPNTPIMRWHVPGVPSRFKVWVKRDDLSGMEWSGNKIRKLEFLLAEAKDAGADCVVTIGALQSNHARATAAAARAVGLDVHLVLRTPDVHSDGGLAGNMAINRLVGAKIHLVTPQDYQKFGFQALVDEVVEQLKAEGRKPVGIPAGGSNATGNWGYMMCVDEITQQSKDMGVKFSDIAMSCGSGGTLGGVGLGVKLSGLDARVHGFTVCDDKEYFLNYIDRKIFSGILPGSSHIRASDCVQLYQSKGRGYGVSTDEELRFIARVAHDTGIVTDPVYTGKALMGMVRAMNETPEVFKGDNVLFIHTGGLYGLFNETTVEQLKPLVVENGSTVVPMRLPSSKL